MFLLGTHRTVAQRLRLYCDRNLGAGNFFWHAWRVARDRDRPLLFHPDVDAPDWARQELTGHSLDDLRVAAIRYAHWYREQGVRPGAHVGLHTRDGLQGLIHHIAITGLGAAAVHCNPKMAPKTAAEYFLRTEATVLVGDADLLKGLGDAWAKDADGRPTPQVQDIARLERTAPRPPGRLADFPHRHTDDDLIMISHSSGTTGRPKAPVFHHGSFFAGKRERLWTFPSLRSDRLLTALPHSHSAGISYLSIALLLGIPTLILDDANGERLVQAINRFRPTTVLGFPLTLAEIAPENITAEAARHIHTWHGMGDASHERHIRPLIALGSRTEGGRELTGSRYLDGLGSSEMGMVLFKQAYTPQTARYARHIGTPAKVVRKAAVLDVHGRELPDGEPGMLGVKTPSVTAGYLDDPDLTEESTVNGYFLTGDIMRRENGTDWFHLDRTPDVIHTSEGPVHSLPLEEVVLLATQALDTAVVAVGDPEAPCRSLPLAVVLHTDGAERDPQAELAACNEALARHGLSPLRGLLLATDRSDLPVGVTGKVLKRVLRERHRSVLHGPAQANLAVAASTDPRKA
ncbi:class I adenylate-forming enzyme family protein [Streptomyces sp. LHD-70]|uniref:class I adenylate-forming enzyme family protein n=1 Tax=Streptomyces sp. LHD-70 TaxID=3072140 RepID=UPI00281030EE|nr:class I adenylate-forming enzyme family protein [Streptomyces sp. LHD-70]MDQ8706890.1 class I adenylate-forming enzyme family protein [Streptomyces sp. LHD-70]